MIRLERPTTPPAYLLSGEVLNIKSGVASFHTDRDQKDRRQERADFPLFPDKIFAELMGNLLHLSHGKCAYCESPIKFPGDATLDRFRPKAGAVGIDDDQLYAPDHYWWLTYEWQNLYPACQFCNKVKGPKFPVEGRRAPLETEVAELSKEKRLLVDPFQDDPAEDLEFEDGGTVRAHSSRGEATIATLELNRQELIQSRANVAKRILQLIHGRTSIDSALESSQPHVAVTRAVLWRWQRQQGAASSHQVSGSKRSTPESGLIKALASAGPRASPPPPPTSVIAPTKRRVSAQKAKRLRTQRVSRIAIRNFRGIGALDLTIPYDRGQGAPWLIFLGENGTGKSTILQAVALALAESGLGDTLGVDPKSVLRQGQSSGWVKVWLGGDATPRVLQFGKGMRRFQRSGPSLSSVLLGYGATRLLPRGGRLGKSGPIRLENMFDPFRPLLNADRWMGRLAAEPFDYVARALKDALSLPASSQLRRVKRKGVGGVRLKLFGADLSLEQLSDGYQSVFGLVCDLMAGLNTASRGALEVAEGVVAIDELGAHLHPRWRMRIVANLRKAFPRVQFLVSTHDPLCLRGLEDGEAIVLRRTSRGRIHMVPDLPPLKGLRVDQLLTSEYFGLYSSMDPEIEAWYAELYRLLALREPSLSQQERVTKLREQLRPYELPGATRRERRLLQIIDQQLAQEDEEPDPIRRQAIQVESQRKITEDLNRLLSQSPTVP
jgi:uncharacterized protein (TIGR02646 family)